MNEQGVKTKVWFCSDESVKGGDDKEFGRKIKWDIPLLEGYEATFFKNYSWKPSHANGFFGLINVGMVRELFRIPKSVIISHGWHYCTHLLILMFAKLAGHTVCLRWEMPLNQEALRSGWKQTVKKAALKFIIFPRVHLFLYIGRQNYLLYKSYNINEERLLFCPYAVDNSRFRKEYEGIKNNISAIRERLGIPADDKVILFAGKYIEKKRPVDLLHAFINLEKKDCWLIFVGDGELRAQMEAMVKQRDQKQVIFTGFINQSKISEFYAISDVFVMCSSLGETWGLSVNEAMNFNLPVIVSDITGSKDDLVEEGVNGYSFKTGDINQLTLKLDQVLFQNALTKVNSSQSIINTYSFATITKNINKRLF